MATEKIVVPVTRPYTRAPIPPVIRHKDKRREEKHKKPPVQDDHA